MDRAEWLVRFEVICGVFWLLSDGSWLMEWRVANMVCGYSALAAGAAILLLLLLEERRLVPILTCGAGLSWLLFSVLWAMGDLAEPKSATMLFAAKCFFFITLGWMASAFIASGWAGRTADLVLGRLRFIKPK
jgi:hypothetical protein